MIEETAYLIVYGPTFSPSAAAAEHGFPYENQNEPGEIGTAGRYKDRPIPDGHARVELTKNSTDGIDSNNVHTSLARVIETCRRHGATDGHVHLDVKYVGQCNLELPPRLLHLLGSLGLPLTITCYEASA